MLGDVFKLTSEEKKRLSQFPVGQGLFFAGSNHVHIQIVASPTETSLITTNPKEIVNTIDLNQAGAGTLPTTIPFNNNTSLQGTPSPLS